MGLAKPMWHTQWFHSTVKFIDWQHKALWHFTPFRQGVRVLHCFGCAERIAGSKPSQEHNFNPPIRIRCNKLLLSLLLCAYIG